MYKIKEFNKYKKTKIQLLGSGTILREMMAAAEILQNEYQIDSEIWSVTSFNELRKDGMEVERYNLLNPDKEQKISFVEQCLGKTEGPIMAASDYMRMNSDQIRPYTNKSFYSLGTDGYGRSDTRKNLRKFFEVDKEHIVAYGLSVLAKEQLIASKYAKEAIKNIILMEANQCLRNYKMSDKEIKVPNIGEFKDVEVIEVLVSNGQSVSKNDPLITIESDKSSVEIPSSFEGKVKSVNIKVGDKVSEGDLILILENSEE